MRRALAALALAVVLPLPGLADVVVKPGETLGEIAERYGVSVNRLMQANGIKDPTLVQIGQRLVIPGRATASRSGGGGGGDTRSGSYTVQSGDTIGEIAARYGVSETSLMQANGIKDPTLVQIGQRLVIPGRGGASRSGGGGGGGSVRGGSYTVQSGDTIGEIAARYGVSETSLMRANGISDPTQLQAGSRIVVPGLAPARTATRPSTTAQARNGKPREHVVKPGESLSEIADAYNLPVQKLVSLNNIEDPNLLMSGTRLKLTAPPPVPASRPAPRPPKAAAPKPKPAAKPAPPVAVKPKPKPAVATTTNPAPAAPAPSTATTTTPAATTPAASTAAPARTTAPTRTTATATTQAAPATTAANPTPTPRPATTATTTPATSTAAATPQPATRPAPKPRPATTTATATAAAKPAGPDWRTYGPLQVDWANWQPMGGSFVAPSLNAEGQPLYTAINCGARKLNATTQTGQWRTWEAPRTDAEQQLVSDLCKAKGS